MTILEQAESLADAIDTATQQFEAYTRPTLQEYIDFLSEHVPGRAPSHYTDASEYFFKEVDRSLFVFESEEYTRYGEWITDTVEIPFAFMDNPKKYKDDLIQSIRDAEAKRTAKKRESALTRIDDLKRQLEAAERTLEKAGE